MYASVALHTSETIREFKNYGCCLVASRPKSESKRPAKHPSRSLLSPVHRGIESFHLLVSRHATGRRSRCAGSFCPRTNQNDCSRQPANELKCFIANACGAFTGSGRRRHNGILSSFELNFTVAMSGGSGTSRNKFLAEHTLFLVVSDLRFDIVNLQLGMVSNFAHSTSFNTAEPSWLLD